jgi:hypothetical protein
MSRYFAAGFRADDCLASGERRVATVAVAAC